MMPELDPPEPPLDPVPVPELLVPPPLPDVAPELAPEVPPEPEPIVEPASQWKSRSLHPGRHRPRNRPRQEGLPLEPLLPLEPEDPNPPVLVPLPPPHPLSVQTIARPVSASPMNSVQRFMIGSHGLTQACPSTEARLYQVVCSFAS